MPANNTGATTQYKSAKKIGQIYTLIRNCGGFGGLSRSLNGNIKSLKFLTPWNGHSSMPPRLQLEKTGSLRGT